MLTHTKQQTQRIAPSDAETYDVSNEATLPARPKDATVPLQEQIAHGGGSSIHSQRDTFAQPRRRIETDTSTRTPSDAPTRAARGEMQGRNDTDKRRHRKPTERSHDTPSRRELQASGPSTTRATQQKCSRQIRCPKGNRSVLPWLRTTRAAPIWTAADAQDSWRPKDGPIRIVH